MMMRTSLLNSAGRNAYCISSHRPARLPTSSPALPLLHSAYVAYLSSAVSFQTAAAASSLALFSKNPFAQSGPALSFPAAPRDRISVASYPFREYIPGPDAKAPKAALIELQDFAAHVKAKFGVNKIEPWSPHFPSTDSNYLDQFRTSVDRARCQVINLAVDGKDSPYAATSAERDRAVAFSKKWVDIALKLGSHSIRTHIPQAHDSKPDVARTADTLSRVLEYASSHSIVISLENDDPVSEDPFFIVEVIEKVQSPWLCALPDFANSLATSPEDHAYSGIDAMFAHACCICHVKDQESTDVRPPRARRYAPHLRLPQAAQLQRLSLDGMG